MSASILSETHGETTARIHKALRPEGRETEKDKLGEVFTPPELIQELCDHLPHEVWSDPRLRWLDPAAGTGNLFSIVYHRLDAGLRTWQSDDTSRRRHILGSMLHQVEINPEHVATLRGRFGPEAHITGADFLQEGPVGGFGSDTGEEPKFDVIIANPPYQRGMAVKNGTNAGRRALWDHFVVRGLGFLREGGVLGYITPGGWRGTGRYAEIGELVRSKQLLYLHMFDARAGKRWFNAGTRFDIYVVRNLPSAEGMLTDVVDETGVRQRLDLAPWPFIPGQMLPIFASLLHEGPRTGARAPIYTTAHHPQKPRKVQKEKTERFRNPVVHSVTAQGVGYWHSADNTTGGFGKPKLVLSLNGRQYTHPEQNDFRGELGMTILAFGIPITSEEEGEMIQRAVATTLFQDLITASKWGIFQTDYRMFRHFRDDWPEWILQNSVPE
jgi:hypothetical protein